jgi:two-component system chemotaxis sensor kinase CheA
VRKVQEQRTLEIRKKILGLISLGDIFRWGNQPHPDAVRSDSHTKLRVIVVQNGESAIGLVVDQLIGIQEVVLKSLEKNFRPIPGLSGASILGDGNVSLILDVDALIAMAERRALRRDADPAETRA